MRANGTALLALTAAVAGICATLSGCGSGGGAQAPAGGALAATRKAANHVTLSPQASAVGTAARNGTPSTALPASHARPASRAISAMLASGLYTNAPDGTPHYVLNFTSGAGSVIRGSASFLYQDGRIATVGPYTGTLSGSGKITLTLGDGKALSGRYAGGRLTLPGCAVVLPLATAADGCIFTYHGHVP